MSKVLTCEKLTKVYGKEKTALDGIDLELDFGRIVGLLGPNGELSDIQQAFVDEAAIQCGFCTPGMVMATKALLLHNAAPDEREIYEGLKNNYCRCTGYVKIIEAVKLAAARLRGETPDIDSFRTHESTVIVVGENQTVPPITGSAVGK